MFISELLGMLVGGLFFDKARPAVYPFLVFMLY